MEFSFSNRQECVTCRLQRVVAEVGDGPRLSTCSGPEPILLITHVAYISSIAVTTDGGW
jgi:hypothetical protein